MSNPSTSAKWGQFIPQGAVISLSGCTGNSTGPHLRFELRRHTGDEWIAIDPGPQLSLSEQQLITAQQTLHNRKLAQQ